MCDLLQSEKKAPRKKDQGANQIKSTQETSYFEPVMV